MDALVALVPSIGVGLLFWFALRAMIHADRRERAAIARMERETRLREGSSEPKSGRADNEQAK